MPNPSLVTQAVRTSQRSEMIDVTDRVQQIVTAQGMTSGMVVAYVPHTTVGVTINEGA
jgi:thiamine phosphate synthase YjbQ (UPF0047 family)